jgi:hypothetical protein
MPFHICRKLSATEPAAFIHEINIACTRPGMNNFGARSCDLEAGKLPIETIRLFRREPSGNAVRKASREFGSYD